MKVLVTTLTTLALASTLALGCGTDDGGGPSLCERECAKAYECDPDPNHGGVARDRFVELCAAGCEQAGGGSECAASATTCDAFDACP